MTKARDEPPSAQPGPRRIGFFATTWRNRRDVVGWDLVLAICMTVAAWIFITDHDAIHNALEPLLIAEIGSVAALFGVIIAGLAIFAAFLSPDYLAVLRGTKTGIEGDLWPFWYVSALAVAAITVCASFLVVRLQSPCLEKPALIVSTFLVSYTFFAALNLVGFIVMQGGSRAQQILGPASTDIAEHRGAKPAE